MYEILILVVYQVYHIRKFLSERLVTLYIILFVLWLWDDTSMAYTGRLCPKGVPFFQALDI